MKIYDSLTKTTQELKVTNNQIRLYCCGPTVYNYIHLGNSRPSFTMDFLVRFLQWKGIKVDYLQNITDVDDKIIDKALAAKQSETDLANFYTDAYLEDLSALHIQPPTKLIKVSTVIDLMIEFIQKLVHQGDAYLEQENVFFDLNRWKGEYGKLSNRTLDSLAVARIEPETNLKHHPADFALWKKTEVGIKWTAPFGIGRPGWHTECALLNDFYFNHQTLSIHGGGVDLKFPHHENERIQYLAANNRELSEIWMHNGHLTFNDEKMSKSLDNMILVRDFLKDYHPDVLRWLFLTTAYTQPLDVSHDLLTQGQKFLDRLNNLTKKAKQLTAFDQLIDESTKESSSHFLERFNDFMNDDLNTPLVLSVLEQAIKAINKDLIKQKITPDFYELKTMLKVLGFSTSVNLTVNQEEKSLFLAWKKALEQKDYKNADTLRSQLIAKGLL
ncbi:Cysteine--tRNA ligase [Mesoplasma sp. JKS002660]|uniref:cysteine--tRNA ligase n=1 Tax=Mesoplasma whartonense TaxID=2878854 RepID=UPI002022A777|nr:cysteine--tRNA ligase [Mesoplasma sp. JKS002660]MCL8213640.1 Cysteine--tRNA ligase [Mesoplasma sp. JKS002660]